jgi:hypothetical protein
LPSKKEQQSSFGLENIAEQIKILLPILVQELDKTKIFSFYNNDTSLIEKESLKEESNPKLAMLFYNMDIEIFKK